MILCFKASNTIEQYLLRGYPLHCLSTTHSRSTAPEFDKIRLTTKRASIAFPATYRLFVFLLARLGFTRDADGGIGYPLPTHCAFIVDFTDFLKGELLCNL